MANINAVFSRVGDQDGSVVKASWTFTAIADVGLPIPFVEWADRSVQMAGTWNGATVIWEGSNDGGLTYLPLTDPQGNAISKTADGIEAVTEVCEFARPRCSAGTPTSVVISVILRRQTGMRS